MPAHYNECTAARVFKGECHVCKKEGHPAAECPDKPPEVCKNCKKEGKSRSSCPDKLMKQHRPEIIC